MCDLFVRTVGCRMLHMQHDTYCNYMTHVALYDVCFMRKKQKILTSGRQVHRRAHHSSFGPNRKCLLFYTRYQYIFIGCTETRSSIPLKCFKLMLFGWHTWTWNNPTPCKHHQRNSIATLWQLRQGIEQIFTKTLIRLRSESVKKSTFL